LLHAAQSSIAPFWDFMSSVELVTGQFDFRKVSRWCLLASKYRRLACARKVVFAGTRAEPPRAHGSLHGTKHHCVSISAHVLFWLYVPRPRWENNMDRWFKWASTVLKVLPGNTWSTV